MAYKDQLTLKARGLYTYADTLGSVPEGSLNTAKNVVLDKNDIITPRRGYEALQGSITGTIGSLHEYADGTTQHLIAHRNNTTLSKYDDTGHTWSDFTGTYSNPSSANAIRTAEANKNLYFATSQGVQKLDSITGTPIDAGAPEALNIFVQAETTNGPVPAHNSIAYRVVFGYTDANDNLILGAPSSPLIYDNTDAVNSKYVTVRAMIPTPPVASGWFIQLYKTTIIPFIGANPSNPGDEMQLALKQDLVAGDITNKYIDLIDKTDDDLRGASLYTNATQEGPDRANAQPPQCVDIALFQSYMFYANTERKYEQIITLLGVNFGGSTGGLALNDTIIINGVTYTAKATENIAANEFAFGADSSASQRIETTALSLINVINNSASNTALWAIYTSGENDLPGQMKIIERDYGSATAFTLISSATSTTFSPDISSTQTSTSEKKPNRLYYSKFQEPEAVPVLSFFDVGAANSAIIRILPIQSTLLVFKSEGIFRVTGTTASTFQITLLDNTTILLAPETLVAINNTATGLFNQGVAQVSAAAVQIISRPIEGTLLQIRGAIGNNISKAFGISYESDRKYLLAIPQIATDTTNTIVYVFNNVTTSWTTYDLAKTAGIVRKFDDKLYWGQVGKISKERKTYDETDFADESIVTVTSAVNVTKTILSIDVISSARTGYLYYESPSKFSVISYVDLVNGQITVQDPLNWSTGTFQILPYISTDIEWNPITAQSPHVLKQWSECVLLAESPVSDANMYFKTIISGDFEGVMFQDQTIGLWGLFPWGQVPWGGEPMRARYRTYIPRNKQKDTLIIPRLTQNTVFSHFEIAGLGFYYRVISNRSGR